MHEGVNWMTVAGLLQAFAGTRSSYETSNKSARVKQIREISVESLGLEPPCNEVVIPQFFSTSFIKYLVDITNLVQLLCFIANLCPWF